MWIKRNLRVWLNRDRDINEIIKNLKKFLEMNKDDSKVKI